jgi:hypothetical protein
LMHKKESKVIHERDLVTWRCAVTMGSRNDCG